MLIYPKSKKVRNVPLLLSPVLAFSQGKTVYLTCDEKQYAQWVDNYNKIYQQRNADIRIQGFSEIITQAHECKNYVQKSFGMDSYKFNLKVFLSDLYT
jgi:DNA-binding SARP family transcriptional activator